MIYFIQSGTNGPIKVGKAGNIQRRLKSLQTAHPENLVILKTIPGDSEKEAIIKRDLKKFNVQGEWFQSVPEVLEYIRKVGCAGYEIRQGIAFAVLVREEEGSYTELCPFCGLRHLHGAGDGHRAAHCTQGEDELLCEDGTILRRNMGYIIKTRTKD